MSELEKTIEETVKKIIKDEEALKLLRMNEYLKDEIRFLNRQIDRMESQVTENKIVLVKKYPESNEFVFFWFWHPIEKFFLTNREPERKKLLEYFDKYLLLNNKNVGK